MSRLIIQTRITRYLITDNGSILIGSNVTSGYTVQLTTTSASNGNITVASSNNAGQWILTTGGIGVHY